MQNYYQYQFLVKNPEHWNEILIAELENTAMESFMEEEQGFSAYSTNATIDEEIEVILNHYKAENTNFEASYTKITIPYQNWNEEWEKNFQIGKTSGSGPAFVVASSSSGSGSFPV